MTLFFWILLFTTLGGVLSVLAAGVVLLIPDGVQRRVLPSMVGYATGALLGAAFIGLLPHALEQSNGAFEQLTATLLFGILLFFMLEKMVLWRHCHTESCETHGAPAGSIVTGERNTAGVMILLGDTTHNFIDGVLIATAFTADIQLGILTALAVTAHEIPQEMGDFAILLHSGYPRRRALLLNMLVSLSTVVGGMLAWAAMSVVAPLQPYILALAASSFIYIAVADLIPDLHKRMDLKATIGQVTLIGFGVLTITAVHAMLG